MPDDDERREREDGERGEPGAEGGSSAAKDSPPPVPDRDDDSPLGDTDQHSGANA